MTTKPIAPIDAWSISLQQQTLEAIEELRCDPNGALHFKHKTLGYAKTEVTDLIAGIYKLVNKKTGQQYSFKNQNELLSAGWCID